MAALADLQAWQSDVRAEIEMLAAKSARERNPLAAGHLAYLRKAYEAKDRWLTSGIAALQANEAHPALSAPVPTLSDDVQGAIPIPPGGAG